eukprot:GEMP01003066.1.p1 GENE.GEMP01003066.1~~GEMP01003066.1.p1  ORF type:complete len:999 (+),score=133.47 GEMP01003066.1:167-3163(+)
MLLVPHIQISPDWVEQVKPPSMSPRDSSRRTTIGTPSSRGSNLSRGSSFSIYSMGSYDDLGDGGSFEKLFESIPEHQLSEEIGFYETQLDWSAQGVPALYQTKSVQPLSGELILDWSVSKVPVYKEDFWELQRDWSQEGLPIQMEMFQEVIVDWSMNGIPLEMQEPRGIQLDWCKSGIPHQFNVGKQTQDKLGEELLVNWSKRGVPVKNSWWDNPAYDWSQDRLPEMWENATPNEVRFMSFMPGPYNWSRPSFWEETVVDWTMSGMPRIFRKVCAKPSAPRDFVVDWSINGLPIAFRRLKAQVEQIIIDWSNQGIPIQSHFLEERGFDWSQTGMPIVFAIGSRYPELPACDWSGSGLPMQMPRSFASDDILCINWSHTGMPKQFRASSWDQLSLDWSGAGIPKAMRFSPDRFNYVYAKRLEDFFKLPSSKNEALQPELRINWNETGIPNDFHDRVEPRRATESSVSKAPLAADKWYNLAIDWSVLGMPSMEEKATKWNPLVMDWSDHGAPQQFRMAPEPYWDGPSVDWSASGVPGVFNASVLREELRSLDWSSSGIPKQFTYMVKCERELAVDWLSPGLPVQFKFWNEPVLDWSADGISSVFNVKGKQKDFRQSEELMFNWSKKGIPKEYHTTKWDYMAIDWSEAGLLTFEQLPLAKSTKTDQYYLNLDWSLTGLPIPSKNKIFQKYVRTWIVDLSERGVPLNLERDDMPLAFNWNQEGVPYQFAQGEFEKLYAIDWTVKGMPSEFKETFLDMPYMDWSDAGIPHIFNANTATVTCRIARLNPQPIEDYIFDWSAPGLPLKTVFFDYPMFDWSAKGLPIAGQAQKFTFDWSTEGVPCPHVQSASFESDTLKLSDLLEPRSISMVQEDLCFEAKDMHLMTTVRMKQHKADVFNPWNRLTDNRREAKFLSQARRTKKTKRVVRYLHYIQSTLMEVQDRQKIDKRLTLKRSRQRIDKRMRRGDTPYEGMEFIDEYPMTTFFDNWPIEMQERLATMDIAAMK